MKRAIKVNTRETYTVKIDRPAGVSVTQMKSYIATAVHCWAGGYEDDAICLICDNRRLVVRRKLP